MEIQLTEVSPTREILIRTQFSVYSFRVADPVARRGFLSGGVLGNQRFVAFLAGTIFPATSSKNLQTGGRAVFVMFEHGLKRLTTSTITWITLSATEDPNTSTEDC